jgi:hypothetical protein
VDKQSVIHPTISTAHTAYASTLPEGGKRRSLFHASVPGYLAGLSLSSLCSFLWALQ